MPYKSAPPGPGKPRYGGERSGGCNGRSSGVTGVQELQNRTEIFRTIAGDSSKGEFDDTQSFSSWHLLDQESQDSEGQSLECSFLHLMSSDLQIKIFSSYSATPDSFPSTSLLRLVPGG